MRQQRIQNGRLAFTMLEVTFVIVILGIVSSIGAEIIANAYQSYIVQRAQYRAYMKVENTLTQIANRLNYAIPGTVYRRIGTGGAPEEITTPIAGNPDDYTVLQWVGYDADSFGAIDSGANRRPGWDGFCDLDNSIGTNISSPGSNLDLASTVISNLGGSIGSSYLYFSGYDTGFPVSSASGTTITLGVTPPVKVEHYKLAWTSYALSVEGGDLYLYHNFTALPATNIGGSKTLLLKNVTNFKWRGDGRTIRVKFCVDEQIGDGSIPSCAEKAVF